MRGISTCFDISMRPNIHYKNGTEIVGNLINDGMISHTCHEPIPTIWLGRWIKEGNYIVSESPPWKFGVEEEAKVKKKQGGLKIEQSVDILNTIKAKRTYAYDGNANEEEETTDDTAINLSTVM